LRSRSAPLSGEKNGDGGKPYRAFHDERNEEVVFTPLNRAVGLSPIAILFAMMVAISFPDTLNPILGIILAVPITTIIAIFLEDLKDFQQR
jgi:hypothetical protein